MIPRKAGVEVNANSSIVIDVEFGTSRRIKVVVVAYASMLALVWMMFDGGNMSSEFKVQTLSIVNL